MKCGKHNFGWFLSVRGPAYSAGPVWCCTPLPDALHLIHGPLDVLLIQGHPGALSSGQRLHRLSFSWLQEKDVIFGGEKKLLCMSELGDIHQPKQPLFHLHCGDYR
ncbi:MAG: hypothetical protein R2941_09430 [Desulfobacterales bacterium]